MRYCSDERKQKEKRSALVSSFQCHFSVRHMAFECLDYLLDIWGKTRCLQFWKLKIYIYYKTLITAVSNSWFDQGYKF